ncbi:hypothetical protein C4564_01880 [Candidatus Microgenomates bacterium]|nr:MAG: hypothetical protein C4564_01880 [Candidatus Microgenomates bacterium]
MSDKIKLWRNIANHGRGSEMTKVLHEACDELARAKQDLIATESLLSEHKRKHEWWRKETSRACAELDETRAELARAQRVVEVARYLLSDENGPLYSSKLSALLQALDDYKAGRGEKK